VTGARHPGGDIAEALAERGDLVAPRGHLAGIGAHVHAAVVVGCESCQEIGLAAGCGGGFEED